MIELNKKEIQIVSGAGNINYCINAYDECWDRMPGSGKSACSSFLKNLFIDTETQAYYDLAGNVVAADLVAECEWLRYREEVMASVNIVLGGSLGFAIPFALWFSIRKIVNYL